MFLSGTRGGERFGPKLHRIKGDSKWLAACKGASQQGGQTASNRGVDEQSLRLSVDEGNGLR